MANTPVTQIKSFKSTLAVQSFTPTCRRRFCFSIQGNDYVVLPLLCVIHVLSQLQQDNQTPNKVLAIRLPVVIPEVANKESMLVIPSFHFNVADCEMNYGQCLWPNCPPVFKLCYLIRGKGQEDVHFLLSG